MTGFVHAQAPASIAGVTLGVKITAGDGVVFATNGFYVLVMANDGNSFQSFSDKTTTEAGTFSSYLASGATATAAFTLTSPETIPGSIICVYTNSLSGTNSVTAPLVDAYQNGDFVMFTNPAPDSIAGQSFYVSIQDGGGAFATNGDFVLSLASSGDTYTITSFSGGGVNSQGTYSYSKVNNSCSQIQLADSNGTNNSTVYVGFSSATAGGYYLASTNGYQIGQLTLLTAQLPVSIAGETIFSTVTSGTGVVPAHGYNFFVPADSGNGYQSIGITENDNSDGTYSYSSSGPIGTLNLLDSVDGPAVVNVFVLSPLQGKYFETVGSYGTQTADGILFTNPVPDSIAGQDFYVNIQDGGGVFATNGDFVISFASSGNSYTITAFNAGGVSSQGAYSYSKLNSTCGGITLTDSVTGVSAVYLSLSNSISGVFALSQSPGNYQLGSVTLLTSQAPVSIAGDTIFAAVTSGTLPFATNGYFLFIPADSGTNYQNIGIAHTAGNSGTYSYSASGTGGTLSINDEVDGYLDSCSFFLFSSFSGKLISSLGPYSQAADVTLFTNAVPDLIAGEAFNISVMDGGAPFAASGSYVLTTAASGNTYTITPVGDSGTSSHGTYSYSKVNSSCGGIRLTDSVTGVSSAYLSLSNSISGVFALTQSPDSYQIGSVTMLPMLNLIQNGNQVMVSWTTNAAGFSLQSSTSLSPTAIWSAAPAPTIVGGNYISTDVISGNAMFYRLKK